MYNLRIANPNASATLVENFADLLPSKETKTFPIIFRLSCLWTPRELANIFRNEVDVDTRASVAIVSRETKFATCALEKYTRLAFPRSGA